MTKTLVQISLALAFTMAGSAIAPREALAQETLEIIPLRHRPADQVMPVLRPLVEPGGAISGQGYQLFVRTSPRNLQDLKAALAAIDTQPRQLQILVHFGDDAERSSAVVHSTRGEAVAQRIQVLEGARAFISTGRSRPLRQSTVSSGPRGTVVSSSTVIQEVATGFEVVPRVSGDRVYLDIRPRRDRPGAYDPASVDSQQVASTVSARLGEWIELGGSSESVSSSSNLSSASASAERSVWVKVEELQR